MSVVPNPGCCSDPRHLCARCREAAAAWPMEEEHDWVARAFATGDWNALVRHLPSGKQSGLPGWIANRADERPLDLDGLRVQLERPAPVTDRAVGPEAIDLDALRLQGEAGHAAGALADGEALDLYGRRER